MNLEYNVFGELLVLNKAQEENHWECLCSCGNFRVVEEKDLLDGTVDCCLEEEHFPWMNNCSWEMPEGWKKAFCKELCRELNDLLKKANYEDKYQLVQVKEKYAQLRWYDNGVPESISKEYYDLIRKYEFLSEKTCQWCGKEAEVKSKAGWMIALCDKCEREMEDGTI